MRVLSIKRAELFGLGGRILRFGATKKEELFGFVGDSLRLLSTKKEELFGVVGRFKGLAPLRNQN